MTAEETRRKAFNELWAAQEVFTILSFVVTNEDLEDQVFTGTKDSEVATLYQGIQRVFGVGFGHLKAGIRALEAAEDAEEAEGRAKS